MPAFKGAVQNAQCIFDILVFPDEQLTPEMLHEYQDSGLEKYGYQALIDTGAQRTHISKRVIKKLELDPKGKQAIQSATGDATVNSYRVSIAIQTEKLNFIGLKGGRPNVRKILDTHAWVSQTCPELSRTPENFDVLLGMDILLQCTFFLGHNEFSLTYPA